jgi:excinuclease ABC subunit C
MSKVKSHPSTRTKFGTGCPEPSAIGGLVHGQKSKIYQNLPAKPGVYLFKDKAGNVLYVGKALNLRNRVKNYYRQKLLNNRTINLLNESKKVDYIPTSSEIESLLLEARLVKQYQPKFNVRLKDDKRYLYVGITREKYPAVRLIRQPEKQEDLLGWFGPFPTAQSIREIIRLMRRIFPFRSCRKLPKSPCLYYRLNLCPGMCANLVKNYSLTIQKIRLFLNGEIGKLINQLTGQMKEAARELKFEEAHQTKRQIEMIQTLLGRFKQIPEEEKPRQQLEQLRRMIVRYQEFDPFVIHRLEAYDVANLGEKIIVGAMVVFIDGEPSNSLYRQFKIQGSWDDPGGIRQILKRRLTHKEWLYSQVILVDGGKGQVSAAFESLKEFRLIGQIGLVGLAKKEEKIFIPKISQNQIIGWKLLSYSAGSPVLQILQQARDEAHRFAQRYYRKLYKKITFEPFGLK